ncbi:MAG: hypothetical protein ACLGHT_01605, partial [Acidimicrobiia bacterium]
MFENLDVSLDVPNHPQLVPKTVVIDRAQNHEVLHLKGAAHHVWLEAASADLRDDPVAASYSNELAHPRCGIHRACLDDAHPKPPPRLRWCIAVPRFLTRRISVPVRRSVVGR